MRILFFGDADHVHLKRWVAEIALRGAHCHVVTRRAGEVPGAADVHVLRPGDHQMGWFLGVHQVRSLARRIAPDLVHGHYVTSNGFWAAACGQRPLVLTAWGSDVLVTPREPTLHGRAMRALVGWTLRQADLLTGDSTDSLAAMAEYHPRAAMHEITWGADTDKFRPPSQPRSTRRLEIASLRSWDDNYNIDVILEAVATMRVQAPDLQVHLHLLGGGPLADELQAKARSLRLLEPGSEVLSFVGRQNDCGMIDVLQRCHVSVSVPTSDATSVSLLESMACGLAVVASDLPANRQWVTPEGGRLVAPRDAPALAQALLELWRDPARLAAMGAFNRDQVLRRASRRQQMDRMFGLYEGILRGADRPMGLTAR
jgi:glycosyltransferase involved in cell wall biosynthesis